MVVPIRKKRKGFSEEKTLPTFCNANIPLTFIRRLSSGTIKLLEQTSSIVTLEEIHFAKESELREKIENRKMLQEIFDLQQQIKKTIVLAKYRNIFLIDQKAQDNNIKIKPDQRAQLIGLIIFANLCKNPIEVISYILDVEGEIPFRQKAVLSKVTQISKKALRRA